MQLVIGRFFLEISVKDGEKRWAKHGNDESRSA